MFGVNCIVNTKSCFHHLNSKLLRIIITLGQTCKAIPIVCFTNQTCIFRLNAAAKETVDLDILES